MAVDWRSDEPGLRVSKTISSPTEAYSFPKCCVRISAQTASRRASSSAQSDACNVPALQALARCAFRAHRRASDGCGRDDRVLRAAETVARRTEQGTESRLDGSEVVQPDLHNAKNPPALRVLLSALNSRALTAPKFSLANPRESVAGFPPEACPVPSEHRSAPRP